MGQLRPRRDLDALLRESHRPCSACPSLNSSASHPVHHHHHLYHGHANHSYNRSIQRKHQLHVKSHNHINNYHKHNDNDNNINNNNACHNNNTASHFVREPLPHLAKRRLVGGFLLSGLPCHPSGQHPLYQTNKEEGAFQSIPLRDPHTPSWKASLRNYRIFHHLRVCRPCRRGEGHTQSIYQQDFNARDENRDGG